MKKTIVTMVAAMSLVALLALAGCASSGSGSAASKSASASAASASAASATASPTASPSSAAASAASAAASSAAASAASASASAAAPASSAAAPAAPAQSGNAYIGNDAAKAIALEHAGVAEADCSELKVELDTDDAIVHYDIEFKVGTTEYDYDIDPVSGDIIKYDSEIDDD